MRDDYRTWLTASGYQDNTTATQIYRVGKVEQAYGSIEDLLRDGGYEALITELSYSTADERAGRPNPSKIQFEGNIRNNLQSYKNAVVRYVDFLRSEGTAEGSATPSIVAAGASTEVGESPERQRFALERDMQNALRNDISGLEPGLTIIDDGIERGVASGFIDILCRDATGKLVVVELKAGKTDTRVVGQILGYMGDLIEEEEGDVRGIIVAHDFDQRTRSAAKAAPALSLFRYSISFRFDRET